MSPEDRRRAELRARQDERHPSGPSGVSSEIERRASKVVIDAATARDEFVHAGRTLLLSLGARETHRYAGRALISGAVNMAYRLYAAAHRADLVAKGWFDVERASRRVR